MEKRPFDEKDNDAEIEKAKQLGMISPTEEPGGLQIKSFWSSPFVRVVIFLLLYLVILTLVNRLIDANPWLSRLNIPSSGAYGHLPILAFFPVEGIVGVLAALWIMKRSEGSALWKSSGFVRQGGLATALIGFSIGIGISLVNLGLSAFLGRPSRFPQTFVVSGFSSVLFYGLIMNLIRPIGNEIAFRGFVLQELEKRWGTLIALAGSSLLYCVFAFWRQFYVLMLAHNSPRDPYILYLLFERLVSGLLFGGAYLVRRSLWLPIMIHIGFALSIYADEIGFRGFLDNYSFIFVEVVVAIWLIYWAIKNGQWKPGPGPREMARAAYAGVVKIVEMTDPGKEVDGEPAPQHTNE